MSTEKSFRPIILACMMLVFGSLNAQVTVPLNQGNSGDFVGWDNTLTNNFPLEIRHDAPDQPIYMYTATVPRLRVNPVEQLNFNGYTNLVMTGHVGIGTQLTSSPPLTYLHVRGGFGFNNGLTLGYRNWMRTGLLTTDQTDGAYFGLKRAPGLGSANAVVNWSDDLGEDMLQFIFTAEPDLTTVAGGNDGLEIARILPDIGGDEGFFGIGDFASAMTNPDGQGVSGSNDGLELVRIVPIPSGDEGFFGIGDWLQAQQVLETSCLPA